MRNPDTRVLDYAIAAEAAGFDSLDVSDHFHPWAEKGQAAFAWTWLGAVAARTSTIKLGYGGLQMNEQDRRRRISEAAYYRSERRGFAGNNETEDWLEAERELDAQNEPVPARGGMSQSDSVGKAPEPSSKHNS